MSKYSAEIIKRAGRCVYDMIVTKDGNDQLMKGISFNEDDANLFMDRYLAALNNEPNEDIYLGSSFDVYIKSKYISKLRPTTVLHKQKTWFGFLMWIYKNHPDCWTISDITEDIVKGWLKSIEDSLAPGTYNAKLIIIREIHNVLCRTIGKFTTIWDNIKIKEVISNPIREFTYDEIVKIGEAADKQGVIWKRLITLGLYTGLNLGDCCLMSWDNVFLDEGIIKISPNKTRHNVKGKKELIIPIHPVLAAMFESTPEESRTGYVTPAIAQWYTKNGKWVLMRNLKAIWSNAGLLTDAKLDGYKQVTQEVSFMSLRPTFVSLAVSAGIPLPIIQNIVGLDSVALTKRYYAQNINSLKQAVKQFPVIEQYRFDLNK